MKTRKIREVQTELDKLTNLIYLNWEPRVKELHKTILKEREPEINKLKEELKALKEKRPAKKPRWPENTPDKIKEICNQYWRGTSEHLTYRIHLWNDKAVWTSYPAGGFSNNGGWNPTPAAYYMLSLTETAQAFGGTKPKELKQFCFERLSGKKVTEAMMQEELNKL